MLKRLQTALAAVALILCAPALVLGDEVPNNSQATAEAAKPESSQESSPEFNVLQSNVVWRVISSGGTNATIGSDLTLKGTVIQTAIGTVTSPNYVVSQGFWQNFGPYCYPGDVDGSGVVAISDAVYIINFIFGGGPQPKTGCRSDYNGDGQTSIGDAVDIINTVMGVN